MTTTPSPRPDAGVEDPHPARYRGRFAPSPTGQLHFGSLLAALASCLDARAAGGEWLVRIENLDPPREVAGSADAILRTLDAFGFQWDGPVLRQSQRFETYREIAEQLKRDGLAYPCDCSRKAIAAVAATGIEGHVYPGTCRGAGLRDRDQRALRLLTDDEPLVFHDRVQGEREQRLASQFGDFVIRRADGLFAYQLAVVVDDGQQGITDVVRGCDLLLSTGRQVHLQRRLGFPTPRYAHLPLALDARGEKLSKSGGSHPVDPERPLPALRQAWAFLGQADWPEGLETLEDFWRWAPAQWTLARVPVTTEARVDAYA